MKFNYTITLMFFASLIYGSEDKKWSPTLEQLQFASRVHNAVNMKPTADDFVFNENGEWGVLETDSEVSAVNQVLQECNCDKGQPCILNLEQVVIKHEDEDDPNYLVHQPITHFIALHPFIKPQILGALLYHCKDTCNNFGTPLHLTINTEVTAMLLTHPCINVYAQNDEGLTALDRARHSDPSIRANQIRVNMISERILELDNLHSQINTVLLDIQNIPAELANLVASFVTGKPTEKERKN